MTRLWKDPERVALACISLSDDAVRETYEDYQAGYSPTRFARRRRAGLAYEASPAPSKLPPPPTGPPAIGFEAWSQISPKLAILSAQKNGFRGPILSEKWVQEIVARIIPIA